MDTPQAPPAALLDTNIVPAKIVIRLHDMIFCAELPLTCLCGISVRFPDGRVCAKLPAESLTRIGMATHTTKNSTDQFLQTLPMQSGPFPLVALAGPTASGKSAAALQLAQHARQHWQTTVEIINVDSALVYRSMDIGTAKPSLAERAQTPHHLIDILDPAQSYSAAQFARDARGLIDSIRQRNHLPLLVGGTMLYFKALFDGLSALPETDLAVRARVAAQASEQGWPALHAELARIDPQTAARLEPGDSQRIGRALEVWHLTGRPLSFWHAQDSAQALPPMPPALLISLEPTDRQWLHARIALRFDTMLAQGFVEEVKRLRQRADLHAELPSMRCVGYRQAWHALSSNEPLEQWREKGIAATRQLAKRQITWLRSMPQRQVIACDGPDPQGEIIRCVSELLNR